MIDRHSIRLKFTLQGVDPEHRTVNTTVCAELSSHETTSLHCEGRTLSLKAHPSTINMVTVKQPKPTSSQLGDELAGQSDISLDHELKQGQLWFRNH